MGAVRRTRWVPKDAKQAEESVDRDKEWSELHEDMESEEDPWAGTGMDDAEAVLSQEPCQDANSLLQDPEEPLSHDKEEPNHDDNNTIGDKMITEIIRK